MRKDESENSWLEYISQYPELFEKNKVGLQKVRNELGKIHRCSLQI